MWSVCDTWIKANNFANSLIWISQISLISLRLNVVCDEAWSTCKCGDWQCSCTSLLLIDCLWSCYFYILKEEFTATEGQLCHFNRRLTQHTDLLFIITYSTSKNNNSGNKSTFCLLYLYFRKTKPKATDAWREKGLGFSMFFWGGFSPSHTLHFKARFTLFCASNFNPCSTFSDWCGLPRRLLPRQHRDGRRGAWFHDKWLQRSPSPFWTRISNR